MQTGDLIKDARIKAGITQAELAERLGVTPQAVSQYERGIKKPKLETVIRIAEALGVLVPDLYPEGMQAMPILDWMESKGVPIVSGPHYVADPYDQPVSPTAVEKLTKQLARRKELLDSIEVNFDFLNAEGKEEAAKRVQELTEIPKYRFKIAPAEGETQTDPDK